MVGCYCLDQLKTLMAEHGMLTGATKFFEAEEEVCSSWTSSILAAQMLTLLAAVTVASVNTILKEVLHGMLSCVCHRACVCLVRLVHVVISLGSLHQDL